MIHLRAVTIPPISDQLAGAFPFDLAAVQSMSELAFTEPVTFLVGENGSGKSTLMEAIAYAAGSIVVGGTDLGRDPTLTAVRQLGDHFRLVWNRKTGKGFFLRAEDFFGYIKRLGQMRQDLESDLKRVDEEYVGRSDYAKGLARMAAAGQLGAMGEQYGRDLNDFSHGEGFLELFQSRFQPGGLYLLDEPEVPLSPSRQLTLISLLKHMVEQECQFIIATHSPLLMAFPGAEIWSLDERPPTPVPYDELEHVQITRSFLKDPEQFLRHL